MSSPFDDPFDVSIEIDPAAFLAENEAGDRVDDPEVTGPADQPVEPAVGAADDDVARGIAALELIEAELADVGRALSRLDDGRYGTCDVCGQPIADELLAMRPTTSTCAAHHGSPSG